MKVPDLQWPHKAASLSSGDKTCLTPSRPPLKTEIEMGGEQVEFSVWALIMAFAMKVTPGFIETKRPHQCHKTGCEEAGPML